MRKIIVLVVALLMVLLVPLAAFGEDNVDDGKYIVYLHFKDMGSSSGFYDKDYSSPQTLSYDVSWSFTQKKLNNQVSIANNFEYDGDKYTYSGYWVYEDGSTVTFPIRYSYQGQKEVHIYIHPVYNKEVVKQLKVVRYNPLTGNDPSASNSNSIQTYKHTFEQPINITNYCFKYWKNTSTEEYAGTQIVNAGEEVTWAVGNFPEKYNTITYEAQYQPNITVEWYVEDEKVDEETSFKAINSAKTCEEEGFEGWVDEDGNEAAAEYEPNGLNEEPVTVKLYASIAEPEEEPVDPVNPVKPTPVDPAPTNPTPVKPTVVKRMIPVAATIVPVYAKTTTDKPEESIVVEESDAPLVAPIAKEYWALLNLILMFLTILCLIRRKEGRGYNIFSILLPLLSVGLFLLTENIHNPMIIVDTWTIFMAIILGFEILARRLGKKNEDEEDYEEEYEEE